MAVSSIPHSGSLCCLTFISIGGGNNPWSNVNILYFVALPGTQAPFLEPSRFNLPTSNHYAH